MPRFTVKDLLLATTLIAIGAGTLAFLFQNGEQIKREYGAAVFAGWWFGGEKLEQRKWHLDIRRDSSGACQSIP